MLRQPKHDVEGRTLDLPGLSRGIIELSPLPMAAVEGKEHIVRHINPSFCRLVGKKGEELIGYPFAKAVPEADGCISLLDRVSLTGKAEIYALEKQFGSDTISWSCAVWPVLAADENPAGLIIQVTDMTAATLFRQKVASMNEELLLANVRQHELMEEELRKANGILEVRTVQLERTNRKLVALNTELDEFTNVASHDLQEPLRTVIAFSDLLRKDLGDSLPEQAAKDLAFITDAAKRMQTLIQGLLALSRAGRVATKREKVSLGECANRALEALAARVEETGAQVTRDKLPEVWGDSTLLTELYQNLIGNALKFGGEQPPIIWLTFEEQGGNQIFGVRDNGIGIEPKYAQEIFKPFRRLHGRAEYEGSGIGLTICRRIVERHGGKIWVESEPGKGAHFRFTFSQRTGRR